MTYRLEDLDLSSVPLAGGKGSSLGELIRAGAPVPAGFVVSRVGFDSFMGCGDHRQHVDEILRRLAACQMRAADASVAIQSRLRKGPMPDDVTAQAIESLEQLGESRVSVRSSATCEDSSTSAWAGQLDTYLNVEPCDVCEKIRECWLSLFKESALAYANAHGIDVREISVAVVVQKMVASEVAGIGFSVHPVTQESNLMLIEACLGQGEAIVSGRINPDQYVVDCAANTIIEQTVGDQSEGLFLGSAATAAEWRKLDRHGSAPKLTADQVLEYARLLAHIADHYAHPVDTEWALVDGRFQVLQARPITTLAEEYDEPIVDLSIEWQHFVRRPMSLLEASIWAHWIDAAHAARSMGIQADRALSIQDESGLAHDFIECHVCEAGIAHVVDLVQNDRAQAIEILKRGHAILHEARGRIERGADGFAGIDEAVDFFADAAQYTTVFPAWLLIGYEQNQLDDPEIRSLAEGIRAHTLYPSIERQIIDPLARRETSALGFSAPDLSASVVTWSELRNGAVTRDLLETRLEQVRSGHRFVFQSIDGNDRVRFVSQTGYLLMRLARQRQVTFERSEDSLCGNAAWPGVYRGRARVVLSADAVGQQIEDGEVLVSIQCSPELMPLLEHCGAIVTDEGGIACHAAILARELRKPALTGTKTATSLIRDGDLVEVDAYAQRVRVLERPSSR